MDLQAAAEHAETVASYLWAAVAMTGLAPESADRELMNARAALKACANALGLVVGE